MRQCSSDHVRWRGPVDQPGLWQIDQIAQKPLNRFCCWRFLVLVLLSTVILAATVQPALADHIHGVFSGPANTSLTVKQRGTQVNGSMTYRGQQLKISGRTDGGDYVRGQLSGNGFSGSFEMLFNNGSPPTIDLIMYRGQFGEFLDQGQFVRTRVIPHHHQPQRGVPTQPEKPRPDKPEKKPAQRKQTPEARPQRPALPYNTPQNKTGNPPQRKLPYQ